jgi:hypothetical protein
MPIPTMAPLASMVLSPIGNLPTAAVVLEHRKHEHATKGGGANLVSNGADAPLNLKLSLP